MYMSFTPILFRVLLIPGSVHPLGWGNVIGAAPKSLMLSYHVVGVVVLLPMLVCCPVGMGRPL